MDSESQLHASAFSSRAVATAVKDMYQYYNTVTVYDLTLSVPN
jgi:hypothetical protein